MKAPLIAASLAVAALSAAPALASPAGARIPGTRYVVINNTGAPLTCRYRVNQGDNRSWRSYRPIPAGGQFTRTAQVPGETVTLDCDGPAGGRNYTVRPGSAYRAFKNAAGKVAVAEVNS